MRSSVVNGASKGIFFINLLCMTLSKACPAASINSGNSFAFFLNASGKSSIAINSSLGCLEKQGGVKPAPEGTLIKHNSNHRYYPENSGVVK